jgi:ABC-type multidrug transport system fused ATPase/permease subunit
MYVVFALTLLSSLSEGLGILLVMPLLGTLDGKRSAAIEGAPTLMQDIVEGLGVAGSLPGILTLIGVTFVFKGLLRYGALSYTARLQSQLMGRLKSRMFDAYAAMSYRHYAQRDTGHFVNMITSQVGQFYNAFGAFVGFIGQIVTTLSYFGIAFVVAWKFGLMAVAVGVLIFLGFKRLNRLVRELSRSTALEAGVQSKLLIQTLQAFKYLTATHQMSHLRSGLMASIERLVGLEYRQRNASAATGALNEPLAVACIILIVIVQIVVLNEPLTPILVSIILFNRGINSVMAIQGSWQGVMAGAGPVELVDREFKTLEANQAHDGQVVAPELSQEIRLEKVSFSYDNAGPEVISKVSLTIPAFSTVAFVGPSGAGKSTLVDLLCLLLQPRTGRVWIDGSASETLLASTWRKQIGYVSQESVVFDDTIANNICLWSGDANTNPELKDRIRNAAKRAYIDHFIASLPDGYDTMVGDRGIRLSGGQRQRLFIARELFKNPRLLILDEATSALDSESEQSIQASIDALHGQMTVILIAHRLSTIRNSDRVFVLQKGRLAEEGSYSELRDREGSLFSRMIEMQTL